MPSQVNLNCAIIFRFRKNRSFHFDSPARHGTPPPPPPTHTHCSVPAASRLKPGRWWARLLASRPARACLPFCLAGRLPACVSACAGRGSHPGALSLASLTRARARARPRGYRRDEANTAPAHRLARLPSRTRTSAQRENGRGRPAGPAGAQG